MAASCRGLVIAYCAFAAAQIFGQSAATISNQDKLTKYDKNKNGILDANERARMDADQAKETGVVTLTPFEVNTTKDVGYAAGNTLSGGRVNTPIAITPGSISVMTKEFMEDFNITNMNEALNWAVGMEPGTLTPGSDPFGASTYGTRVRGNSFDSNFPVRNGNLNYGVADSYNSERFEFNRGPDTAMFGDGGPGGRQGSGSKQASFSRTAVSVGTQIDSYEGYRGTLDYNKGALCASGEYSPSEQKGFSGRSRPRHDRLHDQREIQTRAEDYLHRRIRAERRSEHHVVENPR